MAACFVWPSHSEADLVNATRFRKLALGFPESAEKEHMNHPDFRVCGKIFATLGPDEDWAMVKLTPEQQPEFLSDQPRSFRPANGAWGRNGATIIQLADAEDSAVEDAIQTAWINTAPKRLSDQYRSGD
jgi:hypothetical protein